MIFKWARSVYRAALSWFKKDAFLEEEALSTPEHCIDLIESMEVYYKEGNPNTLSLRNLLKVAAKVSASPSIESFKDKSIYVSFLSTTSQGLLDSVSKRYYTKQTIIRSYLIDTQSTVRPLNGWWSNDESIHYFLIFMRDMTENHLRYIEDDDAILGKEEEEFLNSYLYRLLSSDYIDLLKLLLKETNNYET